MSKYASAELKHASLGGGPADPPSSMAGLYLERIETSDQSRPQVVAVVAENPELGVAISSWIKGEVGEEIKAISRAGELSSVSKELHRVKLACEAIDKYYGRATQGKPTARRSSSWFSSLRAMQAALAVILVLITGQIYLYITLPSVDPIDVQDLKRSLERLNSRVETTADSKDDLRSEIENTRLALVENEEASRRQLSALESAVSANVKDQRTLAEQIARIREDVLALRSQLSTDKTRESVSPSGNGYTVVILFNEAASTGSDKRNYANQIEKLLGNVGFTVSALGYTPDSIPEITKERHVPKVAFAQRESSILFSEDSREQSQVIQDMLQNNKFRLFPTRLAVLSYKPEGFWQSIIEDRILFVVLP